MTGLLSQSVGRYMVSRQLGREERFFVLTMVVEERRCPRVRGHAVDASCMY